MTQQHLARLWSSLTRLLQDSQHSQHRLTAACRKSLQHQVHSRQQWRCLRKQGSKAVAGRGHGQAFGARSSAEGLGFKVL